jgi:AbrB family looped-hinge helix DNA binding protein
MALAQSKVTAQGQISVPVEVRRKLGIGPGSVLEWEEEGDAVVVRKAGRYTSEDIDRAIFPRGTPASKKVEEFDKGVRRYEEKTCAPLTPTPWSVWSRATTGSKLLPRNHS